MTTQPSEKQGNSSHAKQPADVCLSVVSAPQSIDTPGTRYYRPLLEAAYKGDWEAAKLFFERDSASKTAKITSRFETALHIAALSAQDQFVENLVELLSQHSDALEMVDCVGRTALHYAVLSLRIRMVKALVTSKPKLTQLADNEGRVPLEVSAREASMHKEIPWFLAKSTTDDGPAHPFSSPSAIDFILDLTYAGHHDIVLYLVEQYPMLMTMISTKHEGKHILYLLASMQSHFPSGTRFSVLEALIYKCIPGDLNYTPANKNSDPALQCLTRSLWNAAKILVPIIKRVHEVKLRHKAATELAKQVCTKISVMKSTKIIQFLLEDLLDRAAGNGISEVVKLCIQLISRHRGVSRHSKKLIILAVKRRQERTLSLFLKPNSTNELLLVRAPTPEDSKEMMIAAVEYAAEGYYPNLSTLNNVAGAVFQMQRELQWFEAMESWIIPGMRNKYHEGKTFWNIFVENHNTLLENAKKWVKDTANSCMIVSTLIVTVLFAAAFTVPGGNDDKTGVPLLLGKDSLLIFAISDALGLFSSMTAILLFLAILTSRYEAQDFLYSLPKKIIAGLGFLFLSLAFMLVAFAATLTIVLDKRVEWVLIPITLLAFLLVALFIVLQLPLLLQMFRSTYGRSIFSAEDIWK
ncbi:hypothetical protein ACJRO7_015969 [Eucalyptus globulus]|uniref:PGG domain-containing protein n=1 Tax=Eucalyptus globulus TaxID=34317 RepID=A0ABD3LAR3_EUCGL